MKTARHRAARLALAAAALFAIGFALYRFDLLGLRGSDALASALTQRGRVAFAGPAAFGSIEAEGATLVRSASVPELERALQGRAPEALYAALERAGVDALLVDPRTASGNHDSTLARLARHEHVPGVRGLYLSRAAALYAPDPVEQLPAAHRDATAVVARALLGGARPPKQGSFPESLRRLRPVEVMVLLRRGERARLWRSARGSSIASALVTAAIVARQRWQEREQAMGGPLSELLPRMDVEVALLEDDGTVAERDPAFIDRVFGEQHGVAYERKGAWRYMLPDITAAEGQGKASRAYGKLFANDGLPEDSFDRSELRLYRLLLRKVAASRAEPQPDDGLSDVRSPEDVLGVQPN